MLGTLMVLIGVVSLGIVGLGISAELQRKTLPQFLRDLGAEAALFPQGWGTVWQNHPRRVWAVIESGLWLLFLLPLLDNLQNPYHGTTAYWVWSLTIIPHEAGHLICAPFGWFIMVLGGSIWQILFWLLLGWYIMVVRKGLTGALLCWMLVGHSFINLSVYVRDAQERDLPLIFGMDKSRHDWWNILNTLNLLPYDNTFADMVWSLGGFIAFGCILLALLSTWYLPKLEKRPYLFPFGVLGRAILQANHPEPTLAELTD